MTVYEIGSEGSVSYIAMELVEGKTLRELLFAGALPLRRLLQIGAQVADGLARAHEAGIVHRDLKPENVMVTKDGLVKILDFGLAKLTRTGSGSGEGSQLATETGTTPGSVLGTVGYMSPEQASARPVDFRSDQFSFGSILYEMATGKRAFQKKTAVETLSAILNEEPEPVGTVSPQAPAPLRWIVERCLAKEPEDRYAATRDLARDLATIRDRGSEAVSGPAVPARPPNARGSPAGGGGRSADRGGAPGGQGDLEASPPTQPTFHRLTYRRGFVDAARFSPDGRTVLYSASWDGDPTAHLRDAAREPRVAETRPARCEPDVGLGPGRARDRVGETTGLVDHGRDAGDRAARRRRAAGDRGGRPIRRLGSGREGDGRRSEDDRLEFPVGKVITSEAWVYPAADLAGRESGRLHRGSASSVVTRP